MCCVLYAEKTLLLLLINVAAAIQTLQKLREALLVQQQQQQQRQLQQQQHRQLQQLLQQQIQHQQHQLQLNINGERSHMITVTGVIVLINERCIHGIWLFTLFLFRRNWQINFFFKLPFSPVSYPVTWIEQFFN